jgi:hypothetical protein
MNRKAVFFIFLSVLAGLNVGTVRKTEDPIRDTQTNPILYEQKKEEEKDGKKGPLLYHVKNYPRETFFIDPPFEKEKKSSLGGTVTEKASSPMDAAGWWEEQPTAPQTGPSAEKVPAAEPLPEFLPEEEKAQGLGTAEESPALPEGEKARDTEGAEQSVSGTGSETGAEGVPEGKGDDYWW